jgi:hypothetical protein
MSKKKSVVFLSNIFLSDCIELISDDDYIDDLDDLVESSEEIEEIENIENIESIENIEPIENEELPNLYNETQIIKSTYEGESTYYDTLPNWFYNPKQWAKSTNLLCWRCGLVCNEHPWFVPLTKTKKLVPIENGEIVIDTKFIDRSDAALMNSNKKCKEISVMKPYGIFCSPWCVMSRIKHEEDPRIVNKWQSITLLLEVFKMYTNKTVTSIPTAYYPKEIMIQYVGTKEGITPAEYRNLNREKAMESL